MGNDYVMVALSTAWGAVRSSGVGENDSDAQLLPWDRSTPATKVAHTRICGLDASVPQTGARVLCRLRDARPDALERVEEDRLHLRRSAPWSPAPPRLPSGLSSANVGGACARCRMRVLLPWLDFQPLGDSLHGASGSPRSRPRSGEAHDASCDPPRKVFGRASAGSRRVAAASMKIVRDGLLHTRHPFPLPLLASQTYRPRLGPCRCRGRCCWSWLCSAASCARCN